MKRAGTVCRKPGCPGLVRDGQCNRCGHTTKRVHQQRYDQVRESAAKRGYDRRWQRLRLAYLRAHPLCVECQAEHRTTPATEVDHITPLRWGGTHDWSNLQALCKPHHSRKTMTEAAQGG